ncbi:hypothetical protein F418_p57 [Hafnia phage Enc34]|uniref:Uncharacterized protein n=1 Tax=Hafnia phage Enc34 TaxID=1150990 RepID=H6WYL9_9CAUD|nr:hypothetical protein F418_p57 [Hafnia phage Enc34]AFB84074.1 hypothetical protein [Hafnia phage Enc34]
MKNTEHPMTLSSIGGYDRSGLIYYNAKSRTAVVSIEADDDVVGELKHITKEDAVALIAGLREAFDIPDRSAELALLLDMSDARHESFVEQFAVTCIANLMYENGLKTAVITTDRILREDAPQVTINANKVGLIEYTLTEEPLNVKDPTNA